MNGLFLSRLRLAKERALTLGLFDPYDWHQALWEAFKGVSTKRDFLFRVDDLGGEYRAYLLSAAEPARPAWGAWETKRIADRFFERKSWRFQLRANPAMRKSLPKSGDERPKLGPLVSITQEDALRAWLDRKALAAGFRVDAQALMLSPASMIRFRKGAVAGALNQVEFSGRLEVKDEDLFRDAFAAGIGRGKAFGFGLLVLSPA